MKTNKEKYFEELATKTTRFPATDQEIEWFQEWLDVSEEGKKLSADAEKSYNEMMSRQSCELMFFFFWLRELRNKSKQDEIDIKVKYVNDKTFTFSVSDDRMKGSNFGSSQTLNL